MPWLGADDRILFGSKLLKLESREMTPKSAQIKKT